VALEEKAVDNPDAASKADSNSVAIFKPEVKEESNARPKKIAKIEEVVKEREAKGIPEQEQPEQVATTIDEPVTKPKKDKATSAVVPQDEQQNADQPDIEKTVEAPANEQTAPPINKKKKKAEVPANTGNLPDASAESWRINCSSRFGGFTKASETYLSSAGKRVSCAMPRLKKMASAALPCEIKSQANGTSCAIQLASVRNPNEAKAEWRRQLGKFKKLIVVRAHLDEDDTNSDGKKKGGKSQGSKSGTGTTRAGEEKSKSKER
jgi:hypothetical protein